MRTTGGGTFAFVKMQWAARGLDVPLGQQGRRQQCLNEFLDLGNMNVESIAAIATSLSVPGALPSQDFLQWGRPNYTL